MLCLEVGVIKGLLWPLNELAAPILKWQKIAKNGENG